MGYLELGIIFVGAIGAALLLGTGTAYLRYRRTGRFPSQPEVSGQWDTDAAVRGAKLKMVLGALLAVAGLAVLAAVLT